jgi:hypothetical protein
MMPIVEAAMLPDVGPRIEDASIGFNQQLYFAALYEDMRLKRQ